MKPFIVSPFSIRVVSDRAKADRAKALEWLEGATRIDKRGHFRREFLSGREEKEARKALARLVMTGELDDKLRRTLAQRIDPAMFGNGEPATEHPARFRIARRKTPDLAKHCYILIYLAERVTEERGSVARAIEAASEEFGLSPKTIEKEYWVPNATLMRQVMPLFRAWFAPITLEKKSSSPW